MSNRGKAIRLRKEFGNRLAAKQPLLERWFGLMGDGEGNLYPSATNQSYVYVRRAGRTRVQRVRNARIKALNNLPVIVGFSPERPGEQQVLDIDDVALTTLGSYSYVRNHHQQHELHNPSGGDDTVWVFSQQFLYLLGQVTDPISEFIQVRSGVYTFEGVVEIFPGATTLDLTSLAPGAGLAIMTLVSIDAGTGALLYTQSAAFSSAMPSSAWAGQVPTTPDNSIPIVAVYIPNGATTFNWNYLLDWRNFINVVGDVQSHSILAHNDSVAETIVQGDVLVGRDTVPPKIGRLGIGAAYEVLRSDAAGADVEWGTVHGSMIPHTILDGAAHTDSVLGAVAEGALAVGNATPKWDLLAHPGGAGYALTTGATGTVWDQTPTWTGLHTHAAGWALSGGTADLNGLDLILDADGDSYLHASADDVVDLVLAGASGEFGIHINGAEDFTFTTNSFNVLAGSNIGMADGCAIGITGNELLTFNAAGTIAATGITGVTVEDEDWVGLGAAAGRIEYHDEVNDVVAVMGARLGVGTTSPGAPISVYWADYPRPGGRNMDTAILVDTSGDPAALLFDDGSHAIILRQTAGSFSIYSRVAAGAIVAADQKFVIVTATGETWLCPQAGNVLVGATAHAAGKLDVNGDINTRDQYLVDGTQVVTNRQTGWTAATGTADRTTFATGAVTLSELAERVKALVDDLLTHGLIGA